MFSKLFVRPQFDYDYISSSEDAPSEMLPKVKSRPYPTIQTSIIIFLSMGWIATLLYIYVHEPQYNGTLRVYSQSPIPKEVFTPVKRIFEPEERFVGDGINVTRNWDTLVAGHDALWIEQPDQWNLPQGIIAPYDHPNTPSPKPQNFYVVSLLHQMHCLIIVRYQYYQEVNRRTSTDDLSKAMWKVHVEHCFEYLRQAVSCGGDLVVEGNSPIKFGEKHHATSVTGWGVEHECIDFEKLRQFQIEQEARYNTTWQT